MEFLGRFVRDPRAVGSFWPSSPRLAAAMLDSVDWPHAGRVLEFGPGTGAFTRFVSARLRPGAQFLAVERDAALAARLRADVPGLAVEHADVLDAPALLADRGWGPADAIISGLPWAVFPPDLQDALMDATLACLRPGGTFATFTYLQSTVLPASRRVRTLLDDRFAEVATSKVVWRNAPPAFVYRCRK